MPGYDPNPLSLSQEIRIATISYSNERPLDNPNISHVQSVEQNLHAVSLKLIPERAVLTLTRRGWYDAAPSHAQSRSTRPRDRDH